MARDKYKEAFALAVSRAFLEVYPDAVKADGDEFTADYLYAALEKPKDPTMGRFALPVFRFARLLKTKPPEIAAKIAEAANRSLADLPQAPGVGIEAVSGFLNARVSYPDLSKDVIGAVLKQDREYGSDNIGKAANYLVEYSSANIAKPFGVGHLRSTIIGHSLRRLYKKLGYNAIGINYPGDWGTQFGKMIVAVDKWGEPGLLDSDNVVKELLKLYVQFHVKASDDPSLDDEARAAFKRLEDGNPKAVKLWEKLKEVSYAEFDRIYRLLGVDFDLVIGESFFNDKMEAVVDRLKKAGLTEISQGALVVHLDDPNLPPALLKRADGATLYLTRDLAGLIYRWETYRFAESLYVVGSAQADHFRQCLMVIDLLEKAENVTESDRMIGRVKHIPFGWVKFEGQMMSTRAGNIVILEDVIDRAIALAKDIIREKNPDLDTIDETAQMIGVGAVIFSQLSVRRNTDVNFIWEDVLNFDGETGPYLQYTHARLNSLLRNYPGDITADVDFNRLDGPEEHRVIDLLADFPQAIHDAARQYEPHVLAHYLLSLAGAFNAVYQRRDDNGRIDKIIAEDHAERSAARIALVKCVQTVLAEGLYLLGLEAPERM